MNNFDLKTNKLKSQAYANSPFFADVNTGDWFFHLVTSAAEKHLINGYSDHTFRPNALISRAEAVAMIHRFYEYNNDAEFFVNLTQREEKNFGDVPDNAWFHDSVNEAYRLGVIDGTPVGKFEPTRNLNRAEAAKLIHKLLREKGVEKYVPLPD